LDLVGKNGEISEKIGKKTRDEFMRKTNTGLTAAACLAVSAFMGVTASAQNIIYDNTSGPLGQRTGEGNAEIGDQVIFAGTARTVQQVSFEYFVSPGGSGNETATFFMYRIDNVTKLPSTLLYSSPTFNLVPATTGGFGTATINGISVDVPDQIAWTVSFAGLEGSESAGLLFYNPPSVGSSPTFVNPNDGTVGDYFLRHNVSGWQVMETDGLVDNLNVRFTAVPEPTTVALMLGGLVTMGLIRRRK
jgi:hypothetical protein